MTNYNDGNWHGWNRGECPVHPKTIVEVVLLDGEETVNDIHLAEVFYWECHSVPIIYFRVVKEHREPREWYIDTLNGDAYEPTQIASHFILNPAVVLVREVLE